MIDEDVATRDFDLELGHRRATGRDSHGLDIGHRRRGQRGKRISLVENLADDVEARGLVGSADTEEDAHGFAGLGFQGRLGERVGGAVEDIIFGLFAEQFVDALGQQSFGAVRLFGIDLALHDIELTVGLAEATFGLDQDHPVHAVGNMLRDHRRSAVINVQPGSERLEAETLAFARRGNGRRGATAGSGNGVEIDVVRHCAVMGILHRHFDRVANANTHKRSRDFAVEGPVMIGRTVGELAGELDRFKIDLDRRRSAAGERSGKIGSVANDVGNSGTRGGRGRMGMGGLRCGGERGGCR